MGSLLRDDINSSKVPGYFGINWAITAPSYTIQKRKKKKKKKEKENKTRRLFFFESTTDPGYPFEVGYSRSVCDNCEHRVQLAVESYHETILAIKDHWRLKDCIWLRHSYSEAFDFSQRWCALLKRKMGSKLSQDGRARKIWIWR